MVFDEYCDFPYENIGFDTPYDEGGVLMCFMIKEQNRNCHIYVCVLVPAWQTVCAARAA